MKTKKVAYQKTAYLESNADMTLRCGRCGDKIGLSTAKKLGFAVYCMTAFRNRHRACK